MIATFIGHNEVYGLSESILKKSIESLVAEGFNIFLNGGMGGFDFLGARMVKQVQRNHPDIRSILVIPYLSFKCYRPELFDESIYPALEQYYFKQAIKERNKYLVNSSNAALCYVEHSWGGAARTYEYALKKRLRMINVGSNPLHG